MPLLTPSGGFGLSRRDFLTELSRVGGTALMMAGMSALGFGIEARAAEPPKLGAGGAGKHVVVLGAGMAGLTSAYELSNAGYEVTILEARDRVGGRSWTARRGTVAQELGGERQVCDFDEGAYFNPGPWRIPYSHYGYLYYLRRFGVPVELFNNDNDHSFIRVDKASGPLAGQPLRKQAVTADMMGYAAEMLAKQVRQGALDAEFSPDDKALFLEFLRTEGYLTANDFKYIGTDGRGPAAYPGAGLEAGAPSQPYRLSDLLSSETWRVLRSVTELDQPRTMFQPTGGMDQLPLAFVRNLKAPIRLGC